METFYKITILEFGYEKVRYFKNIDNLKSWLIGINNAIPYEHPSVTSKKETKLPNGDKIISYKGNDNEKLRVIITTLQFT